MTGRPTSRKIATAGEIALGSRRQASKALSVLRSSGIQPTPVLTVVVPTFNERDNVPILADRVALALRDVAWELIFVDDNSPDYTSAIAKELGRRDSRVRCIRRLGRRGLSGACLEGALSSQAEFVAVMDADLQHDETLLPKMLETLSNQKADLVIGSRYVVGGASNGFSKARHWISQIATRLGCRLTGVAAHDPMSGFFMLRRDHLERIAPELSIDGFKILFDILVTSGRGKLRILELPYGFQSRLHGSSKFDARNSLDFVGLLLSKITKTKIPLRFFNFLLVGSSGVGVQLILLRQGLNVGLSFSHAQFIATVAAMTSNFLLNNMLTYRDQRVGGWNLVSALFTFYAVCSIGAISNIGVASWLYSQRPVWWLAGIGGSVIGAVWNYTASSMFVWARR